MKGSLIHNEVLVVRCAEAWRGLGATVVYEHPIRSGRYSPAVDALIEWNGLRIALEGERSPRRILNDLAKAKALQADVLFIVTVSPAVATTARRRLASATDSTAANRMRVVVLPLGAALKLLTNKSGALFQALSPNHQNTITPSETVVQPSAQLPRVHS